MTTARALAGGGRIDDRAEKPVDIGNETRTPFGARRQ